MNQSNTEVLLNVVSLVSSSGAIAEFLKKAVRDRNGDFSKEEISSLLKDNYKALSKLALSLDIPIDELTR